MDIFYQIKLSKNGRTYSHAAYKTLKT